MAKQTSFRDGPREVGIGSPLIAGRQVVSLAAFVVSDRGLEQMTGHIEQIAGGVGWAGVRLLDCPCPDPCPEKTIPKRITGTTTTMGGVRFATMQQPSLRVTGR